MRRKFPYSYFMEKGHEAVITAEKSASASEELNAQAEELKSFVGDLAALVGGNARRRVN